MLIIAVSLGIAGGDMVYSSDPNTVHTAQQLREAGGYIFLGVTALVALQALLLAVSRLGRKLSSFAPAQGGLIPLLRAHYTGRTIRCATRPARACAYAALASRP
jgi:hypothetical protein